MDINPMEAFENWGTDSYHQFPDPDFFLFDPDFDFNLDPTFYESTNELANCDLVEPDMEDLPRLEEESASRAASEEMDQLHKSIHELSEALRRVDEQLQAERSKMQAMQEYIVSLQPFLIQLGESVQGQLIEDLKRKS